MKRTLIEKSLVIFLFIVVLVTFSLAQADSKRIEKLYSVVALIQKKVASFGAAAYTK